MKSCSIFHPTTGLFHSYWCHPASSILLPMTGFHSFLKIVSHSTLCTHHIFFIYSSASGYWAVFLSWLSGTMWPWTWECRYLLDIIVLLLLDINSSESFLDLMIALLIIFSGTPKLFNLMAMPFYIPTNRLQTSHFSSLPTTVVLLFLHVIHIQKGDTPF